MNIKILTSNGRNYILFYNVALCYRLCASGSKRHVGSVCLVLALRRGSVFTPGSPVFLHPQKASKFQFDLVTVMQDLSVRCRRDNLFSVILPKQ